MDIDIKSFLVQLIKDTSVQVPNITQISEIDACKILIEYKAQDIKILNGITPLSIAAFKGDLDICKLLIKAGADVNHENNSGVTPLKFCAQEGHFDTCKLIIESGADVNVQNKIGVTSLSVSAEKGHFYICKLLIESGSNVDIRNKNGASPLFVAAEHGHFEICKLLINSGAQVGLQMNKMATALHVGAQNGHADVCRLLIESGANKDIKKINGKTALHLSAENRKFDICKLLIDAGADVDLQSDDGLTPLHVAVQKGIFDVCKLLVDSSANVDLQNNVGHTSLHVAASLGHASIVTLLLYKGAQILTSKIGETPLHLCVKNKDLSYVEHRKTVTAFLVRDSRLLSKADKNGKSVIDLYKDNMCMKYDSNLKSIQKEEIQQILEEYYNTPSVATPQEKMSLCELSEDNFNLLLTIVSDWWSEHGNIYMLKVLIMEFNKEYNIPLSEIQKRNTPYDLFDLLKGSGLINPTKTNIIIEVIILCGMQGVENIIKKQLPVQFPDFQDFPITHFSQHRKQILKFGQKLSQDEIIKIGHLKGIKVKKHADPFAVIFELEIKGQSLDEEMIQMD